MGHKTDFHGVIGGDRNVLERLLHHFCEDRGGELAPIELFTVVGLGIVHDDDARNLGIVRGSKAHEGNHIVATKLQKALKGPPYNLPITNPDDSPVGILTIADHQTGDSAFHKLMNEYKSGIFHDSKIGNIGQDPSYPTPTAVIDEYIKFLKSIESDPRFSDYSKAGRGFAAKFNIPITQ